MTTMEDFDVVGSYNNQRVTNIDAERSINLFEYQDPLGKKPKSLINTSGLINQNPAYPPIVGGFRAQFVFGDFQYEVIGNTIVRTDVNNVVTVLGTLTTPSGYVGIDANTFQIIFVDGAKGYIWDTITTTFVPITDPAFPGNSPNTGLPIDVCYLDGFFIVAIGGTNNFQLSMFNQGLVYGPDFTANTGNSFVATSGGSPNLVLTSGSTLNYQVGTPIVFNGGGTLPTGTPAISKGVTYYVVSVIDSTTFTISTTDGGTPITFSSTGSGSIFVTNNGQLQQGSITTHPGNIVACRTLHRKLFLFSAFYTEVWENAGIGTNLPFRRNNSLLMEYGTPAIASIDVSFDMMVFLAQSNEGLGSVMQVFGSESIPISTRALDFQLAQYAAAQQVSDCFGFLIKENGLIFYRMNFTLANHTFVYNVTQSVPTSDATKYWHEEEQLNGLRHPAQTHAYFNGLNYVGNYLSPTLYLLDSNTFTNDGVAIKRTRITRAFVTPGYQRRRVDRLQLDVLQGDVQELEQTSQELDLLAESGAPLLTEGGDNIILEQGLEINNPENLFIWLSISKNGGHTYGYPDKAPMGAPGQLTFRTLWRKKGVIPRGQAFVAKFEFYGQVPFIILGGGWAYEILPE